MRLLTFSTLFPSSVRPSHGIFVETRLRELLGSGQVESRVVAPVPWFFSTNQQRFGDRARMASTPARETRNGIDVQHPRYLLLPKVGMTMAPFSMALGARGAVQRLIDEGFDFDVIDAHYFYPDGVAAALLARHFNKPFTITARGTDLNLIPQYTLPRKMMQWAAGKAQASIGVSSALVELLRGLGAAEDSLHVMRNGVDLTRFQPQPQLQMRQELGLAGAPLLLSVGNLV
ncbi:MAG: glycosyltransferase, partial [Rhizobacter sp.]|nr:glycosyltransferase [Rhizobacter sp.]